jgi:hypothetical protein
MEWTMNVLRNLAVSIALCTVHALAFAQPAPALPAKAGDAAGTLQAGKTSVALKHAYAMQFDDAYHLMLTDTAVPADMLARELKLGGGQTMLRQKKASGVFMILSKDGFVRTLIPFAGDDLRGSSSMASVGKLDSFAATAGNVSGQGSRTLAQTMNQGWSYAASFNAALAQP